MTMNSFGLSKKQLQPLLTVLEWMMLTKQDKICYELTYIYWQIQSKSFIAEYRRDSSNSSSQITPNNELCTTILNSFLML